MRRTKYTTELGTKQVLQLQALPHLSVHQPLTFHQVGSALTVASCVLHTLPTPAQPGFTLVLVTLGWCFRCKFGRPATRNKLTSWQNTIMQPDGVFRCIGHLVTDTCLENYVGLLRTLRSQSGFDVQRASLHELVARWLVCFAGRADAFWSFAIGTVAVSFGRSVGVSVKENDFFLSPFSFSFIVPGAVRVTFRTLSFREPLTAVSLFSFATAT